MRFAVTFCGRARNGDYMRGARDLGRKEVSGWRFTLRRPFDESCRLPDQNDFREGAEALETLLDFTCELKGYCFFRSEDQVEAALSRYPGSPKFQHTALELGCPSERVR